MANLNPTDAFDSFEVGMSITTENENYLKSKGYDRRNGSCTYNHHYYVVLPFKKWYYPVEHFSGTLLEINPMVKITHQLKLKKI